MIRFLTNTVRWAWGEVREKLDIRGTIADIKAIGRKHGRRMLIFAILWECIEDGLFPALSIYYGMPELVAFFLVFHFEPITYPLALWCFRMWDRARGLEPWDPEHRVNTSTYKRTVVKTTIYASTTAALFYLMLWQFRMGWGFHVGLWAAVAAFCFVHERLWNDQPFGIDPDTDLVDPRRNAMKTFTYHLVATMLMVSFLGGGKPLMNEEVFNDTVTYLLSSAVGWSVVAYFIIETLWSKSVWGLRPSHSEKLP